MARVWYLVESGVRRLSAESCVCFRFLVLMSLGAGFGDRLMVTSKPLVRYVPIS